MKKYVFFTVLLITCLIFLSASSVPEIRSIERLVPDTAFFYLNIVNMDDFLTGLEAFMQPLGLKASLGKDAIKKRMQEMITEEGGNFKIDGLDFKKPWGFAVLPSLEKSDPLFEVIIPLVNAQKNFEPFKAFVNKLEKVDMKRDGDFAIIFPSGKIPQTFPPKKSIDLKEIESYPKASVSCWIGVKQAMKAFGLDTKTLKTMLSGALSESENPSQGATKLVTDVIGLIDEIESVTYDLQADKAGLAVRSSIRVTKGKAIDSLLKPLSSAKGLTAYAKYLPSDYFFTMSAHTDPDFYGRLIKSVYLPLIEAIDLASKDKAEIVALMNKVGAIKTSEMSFAFDFDIDFAALSELEGLTGNDSTEEWEDYDSEDYEDYEDSEDYEDYEDYEGDEDYEDSGDEEYIEEKSTPTPEEIQKIVDTIGKSIKINVAGVMELKEKDKYRALMDEFAKSQVLNKIMDSYLKELGVEGVQLKYSINYAKDKKTGTFVYDEFAFNMELVETAKAGDDSSAGDLEEMKMAMQIIKPFFDRYKLLLHYANNKCYMAMGEDAVGMLTKLVKTDSFPSPNLADAIKANPKLKELYDSSQLGSTMSVIKYINLLRSAPGLQMIPEIKSTGKEVGIIGGMKYADGKIESTGYWSMDEIKRLFDAVNKTLQIDKMLSL